MICPRCHALNEPDARFCTSCGAEIVLPPIGIQQPVMQQPVLPQPTTGDGNKQAVNFLIIILCWEAFERLFWLGFNEVLRRKIRDGGLDFREMGELSKTCGWAIDIITVLLFIIFGIVVKNSTAKALLLVIGLLYAALTWYYRFYRD